METEGNDEELDDDVDNDDDALLNDVDLVEPINTEDEDALLLTDEDIEDGASNHSIDPSRCPGDDGENCSNENHDKIPIDDIDDIEADFREFFDEHVQVNIKKKNDFFPNEGGTVCQIIGRSRLANKKKRHFELSHSNLWVTAEDLYHKLGFCVEITGVRKRPKRKPLQCLSNQSTGGEDKKDWALQKSIELYWQKYYAEVFCNLLNHIFYGKDSIKVTTEDDEIDRIFASRFKKGKKKKKLNAKKKINNKEKLDVKNKKIFHNSRLKSKELNNKPISLDLTECDNDKKMVEKTSQERESKRIADGIANIIPAGSTTSTFNESDSSAVKPSGFEDSNNISAESELPAVNSTKSGDFLTDELCVAGNNGIGVVSQVLAVAETNHDVQESGQCIAAVINSIDNSEIEQSSGVHYENTLYAVQILPSLGDNAAGAAYELLPTLNENTLNAQDTRDTDFVVTELEPSVFEPLGAGPDTVAVAEQSRVVNSNTIYVDSELSSVVDKSLSVELHSVVTTSSTESNDSSCKRKSATERSFPCLMCGKSFALRVALKKHQVLHGNMNVGNKIENTGGYSDILSDNEMVPDSEGEDFQDNEEAAEEEGDADEMADEMEDEVTDSDDYDEDDPLDSDYVAETDEEGSSMETEEDGESAGMVDADEDPVAATTTNTTTTSTASETGGKDGADDADTGVMNDEAFLCSEHDKRPQSVGKTLVDTTGKGCFLCNIFDKANIGTKKTYSCSLCYKNYPTIKTLRAHQNSHFRQKRFKCRTCELRFRDEGRRKEHEAVHKKEKNLFTCKVCGDGFMRRNSFRTHLVAHTNEKPFACTLCDERYKFLSQLKFHHLSHINDAPFKCKKCNISYRHKAVWKEHLLKHRLLAMSNGDNGQRTDLMNLLDDPGDDDFNEGINGITTSASHTSSTTTTISTATTTTLLSTSPTSKIQLHLRASATTCAEATTLTQEATMDIELESSLSMAKTASNKSLPLLTAAVIAAIARSPFPLVVVSATATTGIQSSPLLPSPSSAPDRFLIPSTRTITDISPPPSPIAAKKLRVDSPVESKSIVPLVLVPSVPPVTCGSVPPVTYGSVPPVTYGSVPPVTCGSASPVTCDKVTTTSVISMTTLIPCQQNGHPTKPAETNTSVFTISDEEDQSNPKKNSFICESCGHSFTSRIKLKKHEKTHAKRTKKISCKFCDQKFYSKVILRNHEKTHERSNLSQHDESDVGNENNGFDKNCVNNSNQLHCNGSLGNGEPEVLDLCLDESDEEVQRHPCPICGKSFKSVEKLRKHERNKHILNRGKLFPCEVCELTFSTKVLLIKHAKIHRIRERTLTSKINVESKHESIDLSED